jgi:hypothetical protein
MITGLGMVLYSRPGIVLGRGHRKILKAATWMIIIDAILFHVTTTGDNTFDGYSLLLMVASGKLGIKIRQSDQKLRAGLQAHSKKSR